MKKNKKYPNVTFSQWKNDEGELSLKLFIKGSDVYNFDKKLYKRFLKSDVKVSPTDNNQDFLIYWEDVVEHMNIKDKRNFQYYRWLNDLSTGAENLYQVYVLTVCRKIIDNPNEMRKDLNGFREIENKKTDYADIAKELGNYIEYLLNVSQIQEESFDNLTNLAYQYIRRNNLDWLIPTLNRKKYYF